MKYYKCINSSRYIFYKQDKIYPEDFDPGNGIYSIRVVISWLPYAWQEVTAFDYYMQEGKLPEEYVVKCNSSYEWVNFMKYISLSKPVSDYHFTPDLNFCIRNKENSSNIYDWGYDGDLKQGKDIKLPLFIYQEWLKLKNVNMKEEFVLPEKWYIKVDEKNIGILECWLLLKKDYNNDFRPLIEYFIGNDHRNDYSYQDWNKDGRWFEKQGHTIITTEQFIKYVLKQDDMKDKVIIGYELLKDLPDCPKGELSYEIDENKDVYFKSDCILSDGADDIIYTIDYCNSKPSWFKPIYKEKFPQIEINGYKGEFFDNYVKFGCAEISKQCFIDLHQIIRSMINGDMAIGRDSNKNIESVTIGKGIFTKEQIKEIAEYYLNKK